MYPNPYLATAISYLCTNRPQWREDRAIGKTIVSSGMIDRVVASWDTSRSKCPLDSNGSARA